MNFATQIRHLLTFLAGLGTLLVSQHLIHPDQVDAVNAAGSQLIDPLVVILGAAGAGVARLAMAAIQWIFTKIGLKFGGAFSGFALLTCAALGVMGSLTSCTATQIAAVRGIPVRIGITTPHSDINYSSKSGLEVRGRVEATK